jgi:hypothetical protein
MMRLMLLCGATLALACLPAAATADWSDNFDSYANDSSLHGQGGWKGWDNDPAWTAYVRDDQALSLPHSAEIAAASDLVHEYNYAGGQWTYTAYVYIPGNFAGTSYFLIQNMYNDGGPYNWSIQCPMNSATGMITDDYVAGSGLPLIYDQWTEIRVEIDLDNDWREVYYGGALLGAYTWTTGVDSLLNIASVDLYANGSSPVYYDNMSLVPEPAACVLLALGAVLGLRRR